MIVTLQPTTRGQKSAPSRNVDWRVNVEEGYMEFVNACKPVSTNTLAFLRMKYFEHTVEMESLFTF